MFEVKLSVEQKDAFTDAMRILGNIHILCNCASISSSKDAEVICDTISDLLDRIVIPNLECIEEAIDATP